MRVPTFPVEPENFVEGSVWESPYSTYVWLVLTREDEASWGKCLILWEDGKRTSAFPIGSVRDWSSGLAWCYSSTRIV